jgi:hypothetical protein
MDKDADARWSDGGAIEVKVAIELGPGRELGIEAGAAQEIESEDGLRDEAIPQV